MVPRRGAQGRRPTSPRFSFFGSPSGLPSDWRSRSWRQAPGCCSESGTAMRISMERWSTTIDTAMTTDTTITTTGRGGFLARHGMPTPTGTRNAPTSTHTRPIFITAIDIRGSRAKDPRDRGGVLRRRSARFAIDHVEMRVYSRCVMRASASARPRRPGRRGLGSRLVLPETREGGRRLAFHSAPDQAPISEDP